MNVNFFFRALNFYFNYWSFLRLKKQQIMICMYSGEQNRQNGPENQMISKSCLENRKFFQTAWLRVVCLCDQCQATPSLSHPITGWTLSFTRLTGSGQSSFCPLAIMVSHVAREHWLEVFWILLIGSRYRSAQWDLWNGTIMYHFKCILTYPCARPNKVCPEHNFTKEWAHYQLLVIQFCTSNLKIWSQFCTWTGFRVMVLHKQSKVRPISIIRTRITQKFKFVRFGLWTHYYLWKGPQLLTCSSFIQCSTFLEAFSAWNIVLYTFSQFRSVFLSFGWEKTGLSQFFTFWTWKKRFCTLKSQVPNPA